ncbi:MAG: type II toxin-antitoxin system Phd/YefM family antitoxin [Lachnospiraceae bacterium]|nr:type II toxin-antitoxin system Phd/YefM family antitoxin [Lachnospiraceae bacterium]
MKTASIFEAKTNLSKYISSILSKKEPYIVIVKNGKPVARLVPYEPETGNRIGAGKKTLPRMNSLEEFNKINSEIESDFSGNGGLL